MRIDIRFATRIVVVTALALGASALAAGCAGPISPTPPTTQPPAASSSYTAGVDGSVEATGYVVREELEGGFWALQDIPAGPSSQVQPKMLAVLLPGTATESEIAALEGVFVRVTGRLSGEVSVRMVGPEMTVETIAAIASDAPR